MASDGAEYEHSTSKEVRKKLSPVTLFSQWNWRMNGKLTENRFQLMSNNNNNSKWEYHFECAHFPSSIQFSMSSVSFFKLTEKNKQITTMICKWKHVLRTFKEQTIILVPITMFRCFFFFCQNELDHILLLEWFDS